MSLFLGIDAGTTALKAALFTADGRQLAVDRQEYVLETPAPGWVELDPTIYWQACCRAVRNVIGRSGSPAGDVAALAISSQGETLIPVDATGAATRKAIVWLDNRAVAEAAFIAKQFDVTEVYRRTGQPEVTPTWPACKLLWLQHSEPAVSAASARFLLVADYLLYHLTGRYVTERSLQSSSLLLDIERRQWWQPMLDLLNLSPDCLPELRWPGEVVGPLSPQGATEVGLTPQTIAVTGAMDQVAGAVGAGNLAPGIVSETTGGAMAIVATVLRPTFDPDRRVPCHVHARPGLYCLLPWAQTAGMALRWFRDRFYPLETQAALASGLDPYDLLTAEAAAVPPGADGLVALPHLEGAACPEFNPTARAVFFGATLRHGRPHFVRAILEAVAYLLKRNLELVEGLGVAVSEVRSLGGAARSPLWLQIKADVLQKPVATVETEEVACLGATLLAATAVGRFSSLEKAAAAMVRLRPPLQPQAKHAAAYQTGYARYLELYDRLAPMFAGK